MPPSKSKGLEEYAEGGQTFIRIKNGSKRSLADEGIALSGAGRGDKDTRMNDALSLVITWRWMEFLTAIARCATL